MFCVFIYLVVAIVMFLIMARIEHKKGSYDDFTSACLAFFSLVWVVFLPMILVFWLFKLLGKLVTGGKND